jgi:hypothetical protein
MLQLKEQECLCCREDVDFIVDDILNSKLKENEFDYIFDRDYFFMFCHQHIANLH